MTSLLSSSPLNFHTGRKFVIDKLESTDRVTSPFMALIMLPVVAIGRRVGKPAMFTFNRGNYLEENLLGKFPYALGGFPSKRETISYGDANGFRAQYGTLTLEDGCTNDYIVSHAVLTRRLGASAPFILTLGPRVPQPLTCCEYMYHRHRAACPEGAPTSPPGGNHEFLYVRRKPYALRVARNQSPRSRYHTGLDWPHVVVAARARQLQVHP